MKSIFGKLILNSLNVAENNILWKGPILWSNFIVMFWKVNTISFSVRKPQLHGQTVEVKQPISQRDYLNLLTHRDDTHLPVFKTRRCFLYQVCIFGCPVFFSGQFFLWSAKSCLSLLSFFLCFFFLNGKWFFCAKYSFDKTPGRGFAIRTEVIKHSHHQFFSIYFQ